MLRVVLVHLGMYAQDLRSIRDACSYLLGHLEECPHEMLALQALGAEYMSSS